VNDPLTEVHFWAQVIGDAKRTVICSPDLESRVKGWVEARGMGGIITVQAGPFVPDNRLYIIDTPALDASLQQSIQEGIRNWRPTSEWPGGDLLSDLEAARRFFRGITEG
jgi:hypothetical protein